MQQQASMTKLPSIHAMLEGISLSEDDNRRQQQKQRSIGCKRNASEHTSAFTPIGDSSAANSIHGKLEKLSNCHHKQPTPMEPRLQDHLTKNNNNNNNINNNNTSSSLREILPPFSTRISHLHTHHHYHHQHHHHSPRNLHSRSYSDYTHPYPPSSPPRVSGATTQLAPLHRTFHRRAVSTNTLDFILQPLMQRPLDTYNAPPQLYASSSTASTVTNAPYSPTNEEGGYTSDESNTSTTRSCPPSTTLPSESTCQERPPCFQDFVIKTEDQQPQQRPATTTSTTTTTTTPITTAVNKYNCSYCEKTFSRPSSLQIHTYSHTGERPFECPEIGCSRKFSVQSNMRRHLRVHRLGRPLKRNGGPITPADRAQLINKPLAAKPLPPQQQQWISVTSHYHQAQPQAQQGQYYSYSS